MKTVTDSPSPYRFLSRLVTVGLIVRALLGFVYQPVVAPDTHGYVRLAQQIYTWDYTGYDGRRTPVYPLFLLAGALNEKAVWCLQALLGVAISVLLYLIAFEDKRQSGWALLVGLSHMVALNQLFYEPVLVTETLATFFVVASIFLFTRSLAGGGARVFNFFAPGVITALAALTRPLLLILAPVYFVALLLTLPPGRGRRAPSLAFAVPVLLAVGTWSLVNYVSLGYFGPTTLTGYNLTQHSGAFIELAPDEYGEIRDLYLKYREPRRRATGSHSMTIWDASREMQEQTGLSYAELSKRLTKLSLTLFLHYPGHYLKSVATAAVDFWRVMNPWQLDALNPWTAAVLQLIWKIERIILILFNGGFLLVAAQRVVRAWRRRDVRAPSLESVMIAIVVSGCIAQALTEYGENARYAIPFQPLVVYVVLSALRSELLRWRALPGASG